MPRKSIEMAALCVARLTEPGLHFVGVVAGLALQVQPSGARSWVLRFTVAGKRREMGLGGFPTVTLADARRRAREEREKADKGVDPIADRKAAASLGFHEVRERTVPDRHGRPVFELFRFKKDGS